MEYSDGSDHVESGDELVMDHENLGAATYDSDHDGVADSVIIGVDDHTVMFTDSDGDGEVDSRTTYDSDGSVIDQKDVSGGDSSTSSSESTDSSGGTDTGGTDTGGSDTGGTDTGGTDTGGTDSTGSDTGGTDPSDTDTSGTDTGGTETGDDSTESSSVITVVDDSGRAVDVGPPTVDMDGDGTADTAVVQGDGGSTIGYTDRNGDGEADQITEITADRQVTISVLNDAGDWEVAQTGTLDANGHFVPSEGADSSKDDLRSDGPATESVAWGVLPSDTSSADATSDDAADVPDTANAADDADAAGLPIVYTDPEGNTYELGLPTEDFNGDGQADTVITTLADGTIVGYSDVDGDGLTDQVTQINTDGTVTIGVPDGVGGWEEAATGTLGANGEFVPA